MQQIQSLKLLESLKNHDKYKYPGKRTCCARRSAVNHGAARCVTSLPLETPAQPTYPATILRYRTYAQGAGSGGWAVVRMFGRGLHELSRGWQK
jgi:hypothetical protein